MVERPSKIADADLFFYMNASSLTYREGEFYLRLARHDPKGEEESIAIYMSPGQAKTIFKQLEMLVNEYEKKIKKLPEVKIIRDKDENKGKTLDYMPTLTQESVCKNI